MVDIGTVVAGVGGLKAASDILSSLMQFKVSSEVKAKIIELQGEIFAAQQGALSAQANEAALVQTVRNLEEKMAQMETWRAEKERYQLTDYGGQTFAYELKESEANGEPPHRICANCYQNSQKSILHPTRKLHDQRDEYSCPACKSLFKFGSPVNRQVNVRR